MDFIWFNLFSTVESIGMFCLMLALFRFRIWEYVVHIIFASFLLSQMSYYMRVEFDLVNVVPLLYLVFTFLFVWLMFRVPPFYAAIMSVVGSISSFCLQGILVFVSTQLNLFKMHELVAFTLLAYIIQLIIFVISLGISWLLLRKRIGFTFIPFSDSVRIKFSGENALFLLTIFLVLLLVSVLLYWSLQGDFAFMLIIILLVLSLFSLIYLGIRREKKDD